MQIHDDKNGSHGSCAINSGSKNQIWNLVPCTDPNYKGVNAFYIKSYCGKALDVC
jgi:hypothetical protein